MLGLDMRRYPYCGIIPTGISRLPHDPMLRWTRLVRPHDFIWVLAFAALLATTEIGDAYEIVPLVALGIAQILEPKIPALPSMRSRIFWMVLKLALGFVLMGFTDGINSKYWLGLLLPVVSGATI